MNEDIQKYIKDNRATYTREAITANLFRAGFQREDIEQAWAIVEGVIPPPQPVASSPRFWLGLLLYPALVIGTIILGGLTNSSFLFLVALAIFIAGIVVSAFIDRHDKPLAKGLNFAFVGMLVLLVVAPFVAIIVILGICLTGNYRY